MFESNTETDSCVNPKRRHTNDNTTQRYYFYQVGNFYIFLYKFNSRQRFAQRPCELLGVDTYMMC